MDSEIQVIVKLENVCKNYQQKQPFHTAPVHHKLSRLPAPQQTCLALPQGVHSHAPLHRGRADLLALELPPAEDGHQGEHLVARLEVIWQLDVPARGNSETDIPAYRILVTSAICTAIPAYQGLSTQCT